MKFSERWIDIIAGNYMQYMQFVYLIHFCLFLIYTQYEYVVRALSFLYTYVIRLSFFNQ